MREVWIGVTITSDGLNFNASSKSLTGRLNGFTFFYVEEYVLERYPQGYKIKSLRYVKSCHISISYKKKESGLSEIEKKLKRITNSDLFPDNDKQD